MPAAKRKTTTTANGKITRAQLARYEAMIAQRQEEEVRRHAFAGAHIFDFENCVEDVILHDFQVKPSYASILKKGKKSAPPTRGYSLAVAALVRERKKSAQTPK